MSPEDFFARECNDAIDCAILNHLYGMRYHDPVSARELTFALKPQYREERNIRKHLQKLCSRGFIQQITRDKNGKKGRSPYVYCLTDDLKTKLDEFLIIDNVLYSTVCATVVCSDPSNCPNPKCKLCSGSITK